MIAALILMSAPARPSPDRQRQPRVTSNSARVRRHQPRARAHGVRAHDRLRPLQPTPDRHGAPQAQQIAGTLLGRRLEDQRRNVTYTVSTAVCTSTTRRTASPRTAAAEPLPGGRGDRRRPAVESNSDDFRRVTSRWPGTARGRAGSITQKALIVNPAGGLGPRIDPSTQPAAQIARQRRRSTGAASRRSADDAARRRVGPLDRRTTASPAATPPAARTDWGFTWNFGIVVRRGQPLGPRRRLPRQRAGVRLARRPGRGAAR